MRPKKKIRDKSQVYRVLTLFAKKSRPINWLTLAKKSHCILLFCIDYHSTNKIMLVECYRIS
jgi:hypothetical protein